MQKYKYLVKNIFLFMISGLFVNIVSFLLLPVYTSFLSTEQYAIIDLITVTQQLLFPLLTLSFCDAVLRFAIEEKSEEKGIFTVGIISVLASSLIVLIIAPVLQTLFSEQINVSYFIIYFVVMAFNQLFANYARAIDKVRLMSFSAAGGNVVTILLNIVFIVWFDWELEGYLLALIIGQMLILMSYLLIGKFYKEISFKLPNRMLIKKMIKYSLPLIPNSLFWWINSSLDRYFLRALCGFSIVGLYSVASKIPAILTTVTGVFQQAWNLSAFKEYESTDRNQFYNNIFLFFHIFMLFAMILLVAMSKIIGTIIFSKDFFEAWRLVPWLLWGTYINSLNSFLGGIFTAQKNTKLLFTTTGIGAVVNCILNYLLILLWGGVGAAIATLISYCVVFVMRIIKVQKTVKLEFSYLKMFIMQIVVFIQIYITVYRDKWIIAAGVFSLIMLMILYGKQIYEKFSLRLRGLNNGK